MGNEVAKNPLGEKSRQQPGARRSPGFAQEALDMLLDGLLGDPEFQGDLFIGQSFGQQTQHLAFSPGQANRRR